MKLRWVVTAALACVFVTAPAMAIELGDKAPPLKVKEWIKNGPVDLKDGKDKTVYVVEFWATWCGPCVQSIPHLTELQKKYKDKGVVFIGISDEAVSAVKPFVEKKGKDMEYAVAVDDGGATSKAYMEAFKVRGIPHAFIIDKSGAIVWHDHPMADMEGVLDKVLAGKYDPKKAAEEAREIEKVANEMIPRYLKAVSKKDESGLEKAAKLGEEIVEKGKIHAELMNAFAWMILTESKIKHRDLDLAMKAAQAAMDASGGEDSAILDTYARAFWENGKKADAVKYQKLAVKMCEDPKTKKTLEKTLKKYEKDEGKEEPSDKKDDKKKPDDSDDDYDDDDDDDDDE